MSFILALLPILLILFLMVGLRWSAARAGAAGYLSGLVIALGFFGATPDLLAYAHAKALLFAVDVLMIIWAAFLLYRVADEAGAIQTIGQALPGLTPDRSLQALIIGWVFASFLQGVGGFGVPVAVTAPLLVGIGLDPLTAVIVPSIGHGWAVTFGSMGSSFQALMAATGLPHTLLGPPAAWMLSLTCPVIGLMIAHSMGGWPCLRRMLLPALVWGFLMGATQVLVVRSGSWNIGSFTAGLAGLLATPLVIRLSAFKLRRSDGELQPESEPRTAAANHPGTSKLAQGTETLGQKTILVALSGYAILIAVTLVVQLVPGVKTLLGQVVIRAAFPEIRSAQGFVTPAGFGRQINLFSHTGTLLLYSSVLAYLAYRAFGCYPPHALRRILGGTLRRVIPSSVSIVSMISLAQVMEHSGMTETLARGLAQGFGGLFPAVAPWIGAIGAFVTGSNTNSNVVFGALQQHTALYLGYPAAIILAAQTAGAALGSVAAPAKVVVGASTTGMAGREGEVLRRLAAYSGVLILLVSLMAFLGALLS